LGIERGGRCLDELLIRFIECNIKRSDTKLLAAVVSKLDDGRLLCLAFDRIEPLLNHREAAYVYEREWATGLGRLLDSPMVDKDRKKYYEEKFGGIRERFDRRQ
jgi:hypothetical protein